MKKFLFALALALSAVALTDAPASTMVVFEQRTVLIVASNSAEANLKAQSQNPGWTAISARSVGNNLWEVTIQK